MNIKEWNYFNNKDDQGFLTLDEVIDQFNKGILSEATYIRHKTWVYNKPLRQCAQIRAHLKWEYFDDNNNVLHKNLFGYEIVAKALKNEITDNTLVRLEEGLLIPFKNSYLTPKEEKTYQGYTPILYNFWTQAENFITFLIMLGLSISFTSMLEPKPSTELFIFLNIVIDNLLILLHSYFIHRKGYSLFSKLFGVNILNIDGSKISVMKAFGRHFVIKSDVEDYDQEMGIILTKQKSKTV